MRILGQKPDAVDETNEIQVRLYPRVNSLLWVCYRSHTGRWHRTQCLLWKHEHSVKSLVQWHVSVILVLGGERQILKLSLSKKKKKRAAIDGGRLMMSHVGEHTSIYKIYKPNKKQKVKNGKEISLNYFFSLSLIMKTYAIRWRTKYIKNPSYVLIAFQQTWNSFKDKEYHSPLTYERNKMYFINIKNALSFLGSMNHCILEHIKWGSFVYTLHLLSLSLVKIPIYKHLHEVLNLIHPICKLKL